MKTTTNYAAAKRAFQKGGTKFGKALVPFSSLSCDFCGGRERPRGQKKRGGGFISFAQRYNKRNDEMYFILLPVGEGGTSLAPPVMGFFSTWYPPSNFSPSGGGTRGTATLCLRPCRSVRVRVRIWRGGKETEINN